MNDKIRVAKKIQILKVRGEGGIGKEKIKIMFSHGDLNLHLHTSKDNILLPLATLLSSVAKQTQ